MIETFQINNFKSLVDFNMVMSKFTVLIGMNGAGKSTILQAFDLLAQMMIGNVDAWLSSRNWTASDLNSKLLSSSLSDLGIVGCKTTRTAHISPAFWSISRY